MTNNSSPFQVNGKRGDVYENVKILLQKYPRLRDDKLRCVAYYWLLVDGTKHNIQAMSAQDWITNYGKDQEDYTNQASIDRQWQKVQAENIELRGEHWKARQAHTKTVKKDLGYKG